MLMLEVDPTAFQKFMQRHGTNPTRIARDSGIGRATVYRSVKDGVISLECAVCIAESYRTTVTDVFGKRCDKTLRELTKSFGF